MYDVDGLNLSNIQIECKIKMIEVLSTMSIKNRTILEEYKLLDMVKRWADQLDSQNSEKIDVLKSEVIIDADKIESPDSQDAIKELLDEILDRVVEKSDESKIELLKTLRDKSCLLYETWKNLKVNFKIPKKQRIEERKEHERKLNSTASNEPENETNKMPVVGVNYAQSSHGSHNQVYEKDKFSRDNTPRSK